MRNKNILMLGAAALLMASCSNDNDLTPPGRDGYVTFTAELPAGINTRAFADGTSAVNLRYGVYNESGRELLNEGSATFQDKKAKVEIPMITGATYQLVFWADSYGTADSANPYDLDLESGVMTVDYTKVAANDDAFDAFFCVKQNFTATANMPVQTAVLTRPFAQVNIATADMAQAKAAGINPQSTEVTLLPAYTTLNLLTGNVADPTTVEVTYSAGDIAEGEVITVNNTDYDNLAMIYVLAAEDSELFKNVGMTVNSRTSTGSVATTGRNYPNVPYKRNFRTNIVGNLLTSNTEWDVVIDSEITGSLWTGESTEPGQGEDGAYHIATAADLAGLAKMVNSGDNFLGKTVVLDSDIDLNNVAWTPIGNSLDTSFRGNFDGNGHTVYNLNVSADEYAGLFGSIQNGIDTNSQMVPGAYFKNLKVVNATVRGSHFAGAISGHITSWWSEISGNSAENVEVIAYKQGGEDGNKIGGMFGYLQQISSLISNNSLTNAQVYGGRDCGGFTGALAYGAGSILQERPKSIIENNSLTDVTIYKLQGLTLLQSNFGEFIGRNMSSDDNCTIQNNTLTNVTIGKALVPYIGIDANNNYTIGSDKGLTALGELVNAGTNTFKGKTVLLTADIDLKNELWTPIGLNADKSTASFQGIFDGQGHTISNLRVVTPASYSAAGLFGVIYTGEARNFTVSNAYVEHLSAGNATDNGVAVVAGSIYPSGTISGVTVLNATVKGNHYVAGIAGYVYGNITGCTVSGSIITATAENSKGEWDNGDKVGGIVGYMAEEQGNLSGNKVSDCTITGYRDLGAIAGCYNQNAPSKVMDNSASNVTVTVDNTHNYKNYTSNSQYNAGEIIGRTSITALDASNTATDVTLNLPF